MATVEIITLTDSLDPRVTTGVETVTFYHPVFGTKHEIELSEKNREHFANHLSKLDKYFEAAREVVQAVKAPAAKTGNKTDLTAVREWAKANGFEVGERGRIKAEILEAYAKSQSADVAEPDTQDEDAPEPASDPTEVAASTEDDPSEDEIRELASVENLDDSDILRMMAEIEAEGNEVTAQALAEAVKQG